MRRRPVPAVAICMLLPLLAGCAGTPKSGGEIDAVRPNADCVAFVTAVHTVVQTAGTAHGASHPLPGAPWLHTSRWLAAPARGQAPFPDRLAAMADLALESHLTAIANLPPDARETLGIEDDAEGINRLLQCHEALIETRATTTRDDAMPLSVPDDYIDWHRVAGVYPLTRFGILAGVAVWQNRVNREYTTRPAETAAALRYEPAATEVTLTPALHRAVTAAPRDGLGRLHPRDPVVALLFAAHAPVIELVDDHPWNRIGTPIWEAAAVPNVFIDQPRVYVSLDHVDLDGEVLPRLNYVFWFSSRRKAHALDILGGRLDGMTIRLTLDQSGRALHLESMHNCGCYHQHYLIGAARANPAHGYAERPLVLRAPRAPRGDERWAIRLMDRTHYVERITVTTTQDSGGTPYALAPYSALLHLPTTDGATRSLFDPDGLVPNTFRDERVLFWVSGIRSPGAMRQLGRHPTAFVGRRHFDDADLLERVVRLPRPTP